MHIQGSQWPTAVAVAHASDGAGTSNGNSNSGHGNGAHGNGGGAGGGTGAGGRSTPLRVDAQRNLEHVLRAAREVFGELGYGAPMEDVARRARVGVGTVYRRFPSKDILVRRIAEEETSRLTDQARTALGQEDDPWSALSRFLRTSVASGAGRLLPPGILRVSAGTDRPAQPATDGPEPSRIPEGLGEAARVPQQRAAHADLRLVDRRDEPAADGGAQGSAEETAGAEALLDVVGRLVERARAAGALRPDVTVADVLLVIATGAPALPDPAQQQAASARLLEILLEGLRSRPAR
ncbi:TetR/AcrR family transcriptional regulator [Streptomyces lydicus]|uniref:TetR/AcrR family transcriptional regulator n=1 Tax=Streptomyces lydicus TaxID=47763 RepID=UPI0009A09A4A|nr:TetR/AcrR family transcriptional regulator [Streptomyces lydicus]